jgi:hypothetical protein
MECRCQSAELLLPIGARLHTLSLHLSVADTRLTVCDNVCITHEVQNILHRMLLPVTTQHFSSRSPASLNIYRCNTYIRRPAFATLLHHTSELKSLYLRYVEAKIGSADPDLPYHNHFDNEHAVPTST